MNISMRGKKKPFFSAGRIVASIVLLVVIFVLGGWLLLDGKNIAIFNPQGVIAAQQKDLILFTLALSLIVIIPVFTMLGVFAWRYRETNDNNSKYTPDVEGNVLIETVWWGIPIAIIAVLSVVTWITTHQLDPYRQLDSKVKPLKVQVVALQWKWLFIYPEQYVASVNELKIPAGTPVNFDISADAPMSAFWIPSLGTQVYAMNGMNTKLSLMANNPGVYKGTNTNINGEGYSNMNFNAVALKSRQDFDDWARALKAQASHQHLDWEVYQDLAKPSKNNEVTYYHLHDINLYNKIIEKYMKGEAHSGDNTGGHESGKEGEH